MFITTRMRHSPGRSTLAPAGVGSSRSGNPSTGLLGAADMAPGLLSGARAALLLEAPMSVTLAVLS
jgi:hypothetical protein